MKKDTTGQLPVMNYTQTQGSQVYCRSRHVCSLFFGIFISKLKYAAAKSVHFIAFKA